MTDLLAQRMSCVRPSAIMRLLKTAAAGDYINLASGLPDASLFPAEEMREIADRVLTDDAAGAMQYGSAEGYLPLREWIVERMRAIGFNSSIENVLVTTGSEQALYLASAALLDAGDTVCIEVPTYSAAIQTFDAFEASYRLVEQDDAGMTMEAAERALGSGCKALYTLPNFQNPTGRSLSIERRHQLARAADAAGTVIIEDDAYHDLRYDGPGLPAVGALMPSEHALYLGSFSKNISPGLRVGFLHGPAPVIAKLAHLKALIDVGTGSLTQRLVFEFVSSDRFEPHVDRIRASYRSKRDAMILALERWMPDGVRWTRPDGGMFLWLTLPNRVDAQVLLERAIQCGLLFVPGTGFCADGSGQNTARLNFASPTHSQIESGIELLGRLIHEAAGAAVSEPPLAASST